jgi:hypothetical protein
MLLALAHLLAGKFVRSVVKCGLRGKASEVFKVSPEGQAQGVKIHVIVELWRKEADLSESLLRLPGFFLEDRMATPKGAGRCQKESGKDTLSHAFNSFHKLSGSSNGHTGKIHGIPRCRHPPTTIRNLPFFTDPCQSLTGSRKELVRSRPFGWQTPSREASSFLEGNPSLMRHRKKGNKILS